MNIHIFCPSATLNACSTIGHTHKCIKQCLKHNQQLVQTTTILACYSNKQQLHVHVTIYTCICIIVTYTCKYISIIVTCTCKYTCIYIIVTWTCNYIL